MQLTRKDARQDFQSDDGLDGLQCDTVALPGVVVISQVRATTEPEEPDPQTMKS
jgi:hypothetical protein